METPTPARIERPAPLSIRDLEWKVLTHETIPEGDFVYFGLDTENWENKSFNEATFMKWMNEILIRMRHYEGLIYE